MGLTNVTITVRNADDAGMARNGALPPEKIRELRLEARVDTGANTYLVINEEMRDKLGLPLMTTRFMRLAGGERVLTQIVGPIELRWNDRFATCEAHVMPGQPHPLLGVLGLEVMDLMVDPTHNTVVGAHGDEWLTELD